MAVAWEKNGGPEANILRRHVETEQLTDQQIGDLYGVTKQTVRYWRLKHNIERPPTRVNQFDHKAVMPWRIRNEHHQDPIARQLRAYSKRQQGAVLSTSEQQRLTRFLTELSDLDVVVAYDRDEGFFLIRRHPERDSDGDIIRRPHRVTAA